MIEESYKEVKLGADIRKLLNGCSRENKSDTPDYILASYLMTCLNAYEVAINKRDAWFGFSPFEDIDAFVLEMAND